MHIAIFLQDLAVIMIVAGIVTIIFHQLKQPVVLGYILSGLIIGRHTPPFSFLLDETSIKTLAELGVIFLMFSLGLEFNLRKLFHVGTAALVAALAEIIFMVFVGYEIGLFFGWKPMDSLFLGTMLAISSTTIIVKALNELGIKHENFAQLIFGILIIEDILAIGILAILSGVAIDGVFSLNELALTLGKLLVFLVVSLILGILIIPKILSYVARFDSKEMLLITVLGFCFGFSLIVIKLGYSVALGAFIIGAIMAESNEIRIIEKLVEPLTNMFSAIFFVSIGLLVDPEIMEAYWLPILVITIALIIGKVLICSLGVFLSGRDGKTSMRVGMGLAQIGEFSFIIASLGVSLKVMSPYLYPIIVAISAITTFLTPYLIKSADPFTNFLSRIIPRRTKRFFNLYTKWWQKIRVEDEEEALIKRIIKKGLLQIFINLILIIGIFITGSYLSHTHALDIIFDDMKIENTVIWGMSLIISLAFLIAIYQKLKAISMLIAEIAVKPNKNGKYNAKLRKIISESIPIASMIGIMLMIIALSASIFPPTELLIFAVGIVIILATILCPWLIKFHTRLQIALMSRFKKEKQKD